MLSGISQLARLFRRMQAIRFFRFSSRTKSHNKNLSNMRVTSSLSFRKPPRCPPGRRKECTAPAQCPGSQPRPPPATGCVGPTGEVHFHYKFQGTCTVKSFRQVVADCSFVLPMAECVNRCDPYSHSVILRWTAQGNRPFPVAFSYRDFGLTG